MGIVVGTVRYKPYVIIALSYPLVYLLLLMPANIQMVRFALPILPVAALFAGWLVEWIESRVNTKSHARRAIPIVSLVAGQMVSLYHTDRLLGEKDTRQVVSEWMNDNAPRDSVVYLPYAWGNPYLVDNETLRPSRPVPGGLTGLMHRSRLALPRYRNMKKFSVLYPGRHPQLPSSENSTASLAARKVEYVIIQDHPLVFSATDQSLMASLKDDFELAFEVSPFRSGPNPGAALTFDAQDAFYIPLNGQQFLARAGPGLAIYRRKHTDN